MRHQSNKQRDPGVNVATGFNRNCNSACTHRTRTHTWRQCPNRSIIGELAFRGAWARQTPSSSANPSLVERLTGSGWWIIERGRLDWHTTTVPLVTTASTLQPLSQLKLSQRSAANDVTWRRSPLAYDLHSFFLRREHGNITQISPP